jgi:hypothetical protein
MSHQRLFDAVRRRTSHWLGGYLPAFARDEVFSRLIVPPGCSEPSGLIGAHLLAKQADAKRALEGLLPDLQGTARVPRLTIAWEAGPQHRDKGERAGGTCENAQSLSAPVRTSYPFHRGNSTLTPIPPVSRLNSGTSPPCSRTTVRATARLRPIPFRSGFPMAAQILL